MYPIPVALPVLFELTETLALDAGFISDPCMHNGLKVSSNVPCLVFSCHPLSHPTPTPMQ